MYSSQMVLQRGSPISLCGFGEPGRTVKAVFREREASSVVGADKRWALVFPKMEAGGPYTLRVTDGEDSLLLEDVMIGDVWFLTGQSNMWWPMKDSGDPEKEIAMAAHPSIRLLDVALTGAEEELDEPPSVRGWNRCTPKTARNFSACGIHFARAVGERLGNVPIGLIGAGWGGPPISHFLPPRRRNPNDRYLAKSRAALADAVRGFAMEDVLREQCAASFSNDAWLTRVSTAAVSEGAERVDLPAKRGIEHTVLDRFSGIAVFRREFDLPPSFEGKMLQLDLGASALPAVVYFNSTRVGTRKDWFAPVPGAAKNLPWRFDVPATTVKSGRNRVTVFLGCNDRLSWWGAFHGALPLSVKEGKNSSIPLSGSEWTCEKVVDVPSVPRTYGGSWCGRIYPFFQMPVKGVLFYQGESDSRRTCQAYLEDQKRLISLLREGWKRPDLPFYCMQLANFSKKRNQSGDNGFCEIREAQRLTAVEVPNTGCACSIDIGSDLNIHPANKREQGRRFALQALAKTYGFTDVVPDGPSLEKVIRQGRTAFVVYSPSKAKLVLKGKKLTGFEARGEGTQWVSVPAEIVGDRVKLTAPFEIRDVRYLWQNFPEPGAVLFDDTGLPAVPFRCCGRNERGEGV